MPNYTTVGKTTDNAGAGAGSALKDGVPNVARACVANVNTTAGSASGNSGAGTVVFG
jgi:hypothetical protein